MRMRKDALLALVLTGGLIATACSQSESEEADAGTITVAGMSANDHGTKDVSGESELDLELDDFYFEPTLLTGTAGQTVTIELENEGDAKHNFSLPDQAVDQDVESGQKAQVEVTFPDSGALVFFCKYHQNTGMRGGLRVG